MEGKTDGWTGEPIMQPPRGRPHNKSSAFFVTVRAGTAYRHLFCQRYVFFRFLMCTDRTIHVRLGAL